VPKDKVYFFNTYFYTSLTNAKGRDAINYDSVKRWTKSEDIFSYDYIVVPINEKYAYVICLSNIN
jgi:sentrin-specific protease 7